MYKAVIFDLDGTLLNTLEDLAAAGNYALRQAGLPEHPTEAYRYFVGNGIPKLIERITGQQKGKIPQVHAAFSQYYEKHKEDYTKPYPGILNLLDSLKEKGILMGVVSNKDDRAVQELIPSYFGDRFAATKGRREGILPKPNPLLILETMEEMEMRPQEVLYVGDSGVDIETAKAAGIASCGVLWGFRGKEELKEATLLVRTPEELRDFVLK